MRVRLRGLEPGRVSAVWRIRLVAYGARLESVLGASPRGFESLILRHCEVSGHRSFGVPTLFLPLLPVAPLPSARPAPRHFHPPRPSSPLRDEDQTAVAALGSCL